MWRAFRTWPRPAQLLVALLLCWTVMLTLTTSVDRGGSQSPPAGVTPPTVAGTSTSR
jgi:hypothetical protein